MYRLHHLLGVIITATGEHVRPIKSDVRWRNYLAWVKAGNAPLPAIEPEPEPDPGAGVPQEVAQLALLSAGLLEAAQGVIDALPMPQRLAAQIEWDMRLRSAGITR